MTTTDNGAPRNLVAMRLPELRKLAADMGLKGVSGLRKGELIATINSASAGEPTPQKRASKTTASATSAAKEAQNQPVVEVEESKPRRRRATKASMAAESSTVEDEASTVAAEPTKQRRRRVTSRHTDAEQEQNVDTTESNMDSAADDASESAESGVSSEDNDNHYGSRSAARRARRNRARREARENRSGRRSDNGDGDADAPAETSSAPESNETTESQETERPERRERGDRRDRDDDRRGRRGRRNRRGRDRDGEGYEGESREQREEQLQDVAGILDVVDNNVAFLRTSGYHSGPADVYVNNQMVRRLGLRSGDAIVGAVRMHDNNDNRGGYNRGRNRQKYNPLVRVDSVNGMTVDEAKARPEFAKLTPLYPNQRLRLETEQKVLTTRVIDLIMPIGKGQRALIVSPPKAGKTTILQNIANAIATNNPECYLMVVLVDERPEEVTDMQRSVKGEVIASTFDRPPSEHTAVAELAIERAKRLVEQGEDVVVLLDSITRLGRAYNNSSPASGRILSGGVDSNALYPPKRFLGAARNIENGGSLTIIATAMVETGSAGDTVIFEEFKGTGNAELKLDRKIAERRVFPAVDVNPSGTRKDELLMPKEEAQVMHKLRRILSALDNQQAIDLLIKQLKKTKNNREFLMQVASSAIMNTEDGEEVE
ncbi:transcription termination factor Rho [Corynebacterium mustelae]|uniref:Transcription termination factor Rho n=1 Tax=Corynebacterium mustelae TaxID=571915 RepID=A0A0G3H3F5_9CORY|nr:transcription termination factor Rho [Corynebacterium mustelae]AKK05607.1 transcription termination factor Rho [Corynebacterium mustelae]